MKLTRWWWILAIVVIVVVGVAARDWYYARYVWPREIQKEVLGGVLAPSSSLIHYEGFSHWGQGSFEWRYRLEPGNKMLASLCGEQQIEHCTFTKVLKLSEDVTLVASFEAGVLTLEEVWT
jgi:hypothetical protein